MQACACLFTTKALQEKGSNEKNGKDAKGEQQTLHHQQIISIALIFIGEYLVKATIHFNHALPLHIAVSVSMPMIVVHHQKKSPSHPPHHPTGYSDDTLI